MGKRGCHKSLNRDRDRDRDRELCSGSAWAREDIGPLLQVQLSSLWEKFQSKDPGEDNSPLSIFPINQSLRWRGMRHNCIRLKHPINAGVLIIDVAIDVLRCSDYYQKHHFFSVAVIGRSSLNIAGNGISRMTRFTRRWKTTNLSSLVRCPIK